MINLLELADKDFKAVIINFFKDLREKIVIVNEQVEEFQEKNESYFFKKIKKWNSRTEYLKWKSLRRGLTPD